MDAQDRNESGTQRQASLARRLGQALDQLRPRDAADCPDAEVIAAYAEQAVGGDELAQWEGHFAACARCRNILRVLSASAGAPLAEQEVAQLGQLVSAAHAPAPVEIGVVSAQRVRPRLVQRRLRWLAPALGMAAVLAVWLAMRAPWRSADRGASATLIAQAPREEMPATPTPLAVDQLSNTAPQQDQKTDAAPSPEQSQEKTPSSNSPIEAPVNGRADAAAALDKVSPNAGQATGPLQERKQLNAQADGRQIQPPVASLPPPPPPPLPSRAQGAMNAPATAQSEAKASSNGIVAESAPVAANADAIAGPPSGDKQAATLQAETGATIGEAAKQKATSDQRSAARNERALAVIRPTQNYSSLLKAPSSSILWRAGNGGVIERSTDAGKTWASQISPSREDWLAGAAVSKTLCWVAGRNGAIARTTDGEHWQRITAPTQAAGAEGKLPDWTGITARDSQSATIVASDGRMFTTANGGKTWQAR